MSDKKRILILCTGNSARSQMAEGLLRHVGGEAFDVASAGVEPSHVRPQAIEAMREIGIDISGHRSKSVEEFLGQEFDYVITVCDLQGLRPKRVMPSHAASTAKLKALSTGRNTPAELFNEFFREFTKPSLRGGLDAGIRYPCAEDRRVTVLSGLRRGGTRRARDYGGSFRRG